MTYTASTQASTTTAAEADAWGDIETAVYHYASLRNVSAGSASEALDTLYESLRPPSA